MVPVLTANKRVSYRIPADGVFSLPSAEISRDAVCLHARGTRVMYSAGQLDASPPAKNNAWTDFEYLSMVEVVILSRGRG